MCVGVCVCTVAYIYTPQTTVMSLLVHLQGLQGLNSGPKQVLLPAEPSQLAVTFFYFILWVWVLCLHVCLCTTCMWSLLRSEEGVGSPGTEVTVCVLLCGLWNLALGPLEDTKFSSVLSHVFSPSTDPL